MSPSTEKVRSMSEKYNGWANRETWAVALHINNDQGWQESVLEAVRNAVDGVMQDPPVWLGPGGATDPSELDARWASVAGDAIRENVEDTLDALWEFHSDELRNILTDLGSLWRVDWTELGAAFLSDLDER